MKSCKRQRTRRLHLESMERRELLAGDLRIVEINFNPHQAMPEFGERDADADDFEFLEVMNVGDAPMNLRGYEITDGVTFQFAQQFLNPNERITVTKDVSDFRSRFGQPRVALGNDGEGGKEGEYQGKLGNSGEVLELRDPLGAIIQRFSYFDAGEWPQRADGMGSSLEVIDPLGDYGDPKNWRPSSEFGGSPSAAGAGFVGDVVINELLTHTDLPQIDAIELFNRTSGTIDMTNWYLSDTAENLRRFKIEGAGSRIGANDYRVFDENQLGFSFRGQEADDAFLIEATAAGRPIRFVDVVNYGATQNGVSLGRWDNGEGELFPMDDLSFEDANPGPFLDDVIISEFNYHPKTVEGVALTADELEFVEIYNRFDENLDFSHWRLTTAVEFEFPLATTLPANSAILVLSFDPFQDPNKTRALLDLYNIDDNVQLFGSYSDPVDDPHPDLLDDDGETLILERPEDLAQCPAPGQDHCLGYVLVDRAIYRDAGPWPTSADGGGLSLTRILDRVEYGDFAESWQASRPTPGRIGDDSMPGDFDADGDVDADDIDLLCINLQTQELRYDLNADGWVDNRDFDFMIGELLQTTVGDANLDGTFNSSDLVEIFRAGEYEDGVAKNSGWSTGDWNCDGDFGSGDLVAAFAAGGYTPNAVPAGSPAEGAAGARLSTPATQRIAVARARRETHSADTKSAPLQVLRFDEAQVDSAFTERDEARPRASNQVGELDEALLELLR